MRPPRRNPLRALSSRSYAVVWTGAFVSSVGTWMETIAVGVFVTETTHRSEWTGAVAAMTFLPSIVIGPFAGTMADRFDLRRYLSVVTYAQLILASTLAVLAFSGRLTVGSIALLMPLIGTASAAGGPAYNALLINLVEKDAVLSAVSLSSAQFNLARIVGPALCVPVIAAGGIGAAFAFNTLSFAAVLGALTRIQTPPIRSRPGKEPLWSGILAGFKAAKEDRGIRTALWLMLGGSTCVAPFIGLVPAFAINVLHRGAAATSLLVTFQGIGAILAAVALDFLADNFGRRRSIGGAALLLGPAGILYWLAPSYWLALPSILALGGLYLMVATGSNAICLSRAPPHLQARVSSVSTMVLNGCYAIAVVFQGWLGDRIGLRVAGSLASGGFLAILIAWRLARPGALTVFDEPVHAPLTPAVPTP